MTPISNANTPAQAMEHLNHSLNSVSRQTPEGLQPRPLLKVSSALQLLLPSAIENIRDQNNYQAVVSEHVAPLQEALEDSLNSPFNHLDETLIQGGQFNAVMASFRNLLSQLPSPAQRIEPKGEKAGF